MFFELIRLAIGTQDKFSRMPTQPEWGQLYEIAKKQSLIGVCFAALQRIGADADTGFSSVGMDEMQYLTWMGMTAKIQQRNDMLNSYTKDVLAYFRHNGFACTSLKGQGIAKLYGALALLRQSGDVDIWVAGGRKKLYERSLQMFGRLEGLTYHHIHYPIYEGLEIEAHVWPSFLSSPLRNKRLHTFCNIYAPKDVCDDTPSLAFNRVFILLHCYQHFTRRGVGMRQILDYYFVLLQGFTDEEKTESMKWIETLGMKRFAHAMMWVCMDVFGMEDKYLLCEPNERYGRFLLDEVMQTGNMGHADKRVDKNQLQSARGRYLSNLKRDLRIMKICPHEAFWEPLWGIFQFVWCKLTLMKFKR